MEIEINRKEAKHLLEMFNGITVKGLDGMETVVSLNEKIKKAMENEEEENKEEE